MIVRRLAFGFLISASLAGCTGSVDIAKYALVDYPPLKSGYAVPTLREDINPDGTSVHPFRVGQPKIEVHQPPPDQLRVAEAPMLRRTPPNTRALVDDDIAALEAAMPLHRNPRFSPMPGSLEDMAKEDQENVALKSKTNICRGC
jgi:hypothetical protein